MSDWFKTADGNVIVYNPAIAPENREFRDVIYEEIVAAREGFTKLDPRLDNMSYYVTPRMFGAIGNGVADDTLAIQAMMEHAFDNHLSVNFLGKTYKVTGNNPCGLPRELQETVMHANDTNQLNFIAENARFLWYPVLETDMFAFVGNLRTSRWQDFKVIVTPPTGFHNYGDIFSTFFGITAAPHDFSSNVFSNIWIDGECRRVFSFDCGADELQYQDDLSLFEKISAGGYTRFYYTNNSNSVANTFDNCSTNNNIDNAIDFHIAGPWAGGLRVTNHHFTIMDNDGGIMFKNEAPSHAYATIYCDRPRVEVRDTATNWMYFDMTTGVLHLNDIYSVNFPIYSAANVYGIARNDCRITFKDSMGVFTPINIIGANGGMGSDNALEVLEFDHCAFVNGDTFISKRAYPLINYCKTDGTPFANRYLALASNYNFGNIVVKYCTGMYKAGIYSRWLDSYVLSNGREMISDSQVKKKRLNYRVTSGNVTFHTASGTPYSTDFDIIIEKMLYICDYNIQNTLDEVRCTFPNAEMTNISTSIMAPTYSLDLIPSTDYLYLTAGTQFAIKVYLTGTEYGELTKGVTKSYIEITYRLPTTIDELANSTVCQLVAK